MNKFQALVALEHNSWDNWVFQSWNSSTDNRKNTASLHRLVSQLQYSNQLLKRVRESSEIIEIISAKALEELKRRTSLSIDSIHEWENELGDYIRPYNEYEILFVGHSHIDINWQWGWDETVSIVTETAKTILSLMDRYPNLIFSQSQAILYDILARYDEHSLQRVASYVQQGRWEPLVSGWVEFDKNSPNLSSYCKQLEIGRKTASSLLSIREDELVIAFEPDTFGHTIHLPEILSSFGIRYYYMCRGEEKETLFSWKSPSGASLLVYRDPKMYTMGVTGDIARQIPHYAHSLGIKSIPALYGLSDHGGGLSIKDVERIGEMQSWPAFPKISFSQLRSFFDKVAQQKSILPTLCHEMNTVFTACYTSGSHIKQRNHTGEIQLHATEHMQYFSHCAASVDPTHTTFFPPIRSLEQAWKLLLTNQFHDIITGVGIQETAHHALATSQELLAITNSELSTHLDAIVSCIDTSGLLSFKDQSSDDFYDTATGAGSGFGIAWGSNSQQSKGCGLHRVYHVFNVSPRAYRGTVPLYVWNYEGNIEQISCFDSLGNQLPVQRSEPPVEIFKGLFTHPQASYYWGQWYAPLTISVEIPPFGYETVSLIPDYSHIKQNMSFITSDAITKTYTPKNYCLENSHCLYRFDPSSLSPISIFDKKTNTELLNRDASSGFFLITDDNSEGMDAWEYGRIIAKQHLGEARNVSYECGEVFQRISFTMSLGESTLALSYELPHESKTLKCKALIEWTRCVVSQSSESLWFLLSLQGEKRLYRTDVPGGSIDRVSRDYPLMGNSWIHPIEEELPVTLHIIGNGIHGYIGSTDTMGVTLLRSSRDPNPYNEIGKHAFTWSVGIIDSTLSIYEASLLALQAQKTPLVTSGNSKEGILPPRGSFYTFESSSVLLSSLSLESNRQYVQICLVETSGEEASFQFSMHYPIGIKEATIVGPHTNAHIQVIDQKVVLGTIGAHSVLMIRCIITSHTE